MFKITVTNLYMRYAFLVTMPNHPTEYATPALDALYGSAWGIGH